MQLCFLLIMNFIIPIIYCSTVESYWSPTAYKYYIASKWGNTDLKPEVWTLRSSFCWKAIIKQPSWKMLHFNKQMINNYQILKTNSNNKALENRQNE